MNATSLDVEASKGAASTKPNYGLNRAWEARIELEYSDKNAQSKLTHMSFKGPLRVQRPFYPEGARCHTYLLHPPGGMVSGDRIDIHVSTNPGSSALVTTPSAGKIYGADSANVVQTQHVRLSVSEKSELEFLPQENILFDGANANLSTEITIADNAKLLFWDVVSFGRPHGGFDFETGRLYQSTSISIGDSKILHEGFETDSELRILSSPIGLMGHIHMGSFYIAAPSHVDSYELWVDKIRQHLPAPTDALKAAVTYRNRLLVIRALADDIETLRNLFIDLWKIARPMVLKAEPSVPRIWLT